MLRWWKGTRRMQYGHLSVPCLQPVRHNGRKNLIFEFWQNKIWVWCPNYIASPSGIGLQNDFCLVKFHLVSILFLLKHCYFEILFRTFGNVSARLANTKMIILIWSCNPCKNIMGLSLENICYRGSKWASDEFGQQ